MIRPSMSPRPIALAVALAAGLGLAACGDKDPVILKLDGESVRRSEFERHLAAVEARAQAPVDPAARPGLLEAFLEERALVIEARRRGLLPAGASAAEEPRAVARLLADAVRVPEATEDEIAAYYRAHAAELAVPETVTLRQILVGTLNEARDVKRRLGRDPKAFDGIARSQSKGVEAAAGGYMGRFERGQLPPELEAAAFALPEGDASEPVADRPRVSCPEGRIPPAGPRAQPGGGTRADPRSPRPREEGGGGAGLRGGGPGPSQGEP